MTGWRNKLIAILLFWPASLWAQTLPEALAVDLPFVLRLVHSRATVICTHSLGAALDNYRSTRLRNDGLLRFVQFRRTAEAPLEAIYFDESTGAPSHYGVKVEILRAFPEAKNILGGNIFFSLSVPPEEPLLLTQVGIIASSTIEINPTRQEHRTLVDFQNDEFAKVTSRNTYQFAPGVAVEEIFVLPNRTQNRSKLDNSCDSTFGL